MRLSSQDAKHMMIVPDSELMSDLCQTCKITLEEPCIRYARFRWHLRCFHCRQCKRSLKDDYNAALFHPQSASVVCFQCANHGAEQLIQGFEYVTRLQQYSFLLSVALGRLYSLLKLPGMRHNVTREPQFVGCKYSSYSKSLQFLGITEAPSPSPSSRKDKADGKKSKLRNPLRGDARVQSYTGDEKLYKPAKLTDIKRMKSTHMDRKLSQSHKATRRSVIVESRNLFAPTAPLPVPKIPSNTSSTTSLKELPPLPVPNTHEDEQEEIPETQTLADMHSLGNEAAITLDDIPQIAARTGDYQRGIFFSDLSALQYLVVRHIAVVKIEPHLKDVFTMEELLDMIESKKASLWDKFVTSFKQGNKNRVKEMGTFGVPFEALVERNGADSIIGAGPSPVRIPTFIEDSILAMRQMGKLSC
jgi:hypothetical protein